MKIIVTGGAGFIGSSVVRQAIGRGYHVLNLDALTYASCLDNVAEVANSPFYQFVQLDICDQSAVTQLMHNYQPDAVIHLAAESHVDRSIDGPKQFIKTNIEGVFSLLEATRDYLTARPDESKFRFLHVSTDEVYGSALPGDYFTENSNYSPNSPYSSSKAASDHLVRAWHQTYGVPAQISHCSNNYGPYQFPEKFLPVIINRALQSKDIPIYGNGLNERDWLYVEDHASALLDIVVKGAVGSVYNIGGDNVVDNLSLAKMVCAILDELVPQQDPYQELIQFVTDRPGHDERYAIDSTFIKESIGWVPQTDLETGLRATVKWYLDNQAWVMSVGEQTEIGNRLGLGA